MKTAEIQVGSKVTFRPYIPSNVPIWSTRREHIPAKYDGKTGTVIKRDCGTGVGAQLAERAGKLSGSAVVRFDDGKAYEILACFLVVATGDGVITGGTRQ